MANEKLFEQLQGIYDKAFIEAFGVIAGLAGSATAQSTTGTQATTGGQASEGGVSAQQGSSTQHTGASHKNDVSVPEAMESYNGSLVQDIAHMGKVNSRTFDLMSGALSLAALQASASAGSTMGNITTQQNEEYSNRKKTGVLDFVVIGDAAEESADD